MGTEEGDNDLSQCMCCVLGVYSNTLGSSEIGCVSQAALLGWSPQDTINPHDVSMVGRPENIRSHILITEKGFVAT